MFAKRTVATVATAAALLAAGATTATSASAEIIVNPSVDTAAMAASIEQALDGNTVGYAYAIAENGLFAGAGSGGKARTGPNGNVNFTSTTRMEIASSTKNITAAAVLKLLEATGTSVNASVKSFLPSNFQLEADGSWNAVTFNHLLSHRSGLEQLEATLTPAELAQYSTLYSGLRFAVNQQVTVPSPRLYSNMNYAMLRLTIPRLWRAAEPGRGVPLVNSTNSGTWALAYVNERLFAPAGIAATSCVPANPATTALAYNATNVAAGGTLFQLDGTDFEACAGHRGLHLSAMDLVRWQAHLAHGTIVSAAVRNQMDTMELGWQPSSNGATTAGMYWHDGDLTSGGQLHTCHAKFPGGVEASVIMNSQNLGGVSECQVLINAYNAGD